LFSFGFNVFGGRGQECNATNSQREGTFCYGGGGNSALHCCNYANFFVGAWEEAIKKAATTTTTKMEKWK